MAPGFNVTRISAFTVLALIMMSASSAVAQGLSGSGQGASATDVLRGAFADQTPDQRRAFCARVAQAAVSCGTADMGALLACLIKTLPAQDAARAVRVANGTRGNVSGLLQECGVTLGR